MALGLIPDLSGEAGFQSAFLELLMHISTFAQTPACISFMHHIKRRFSVELLLLCKYINNPARPATWSDTVGTTAMWKMDRCQRTFKQRPYMSWNSPREKNQTKTPESHCFGLPHALTKHTHQLLLHARLLLWRSSLITFLLPLYLSSSSSPTLLLAPPFCHLFVLLLSLLTDHKHSPRFYRLF